MAAGNMTLSAWAYCLMHMLCFQEMMLHACFQSWGIQLLCWQLRAFCGDPVHNVSIAFWAVHLLLKLPAQQWHLHCQVCWDLLLLAAAPQVWLTCLSQLPTWLETQHRMLRLQHLHAQAAASQLLHYLHSFMHSFVQEFQHYLVGTY